MGISSFLFLCFSLFLLLLTPEAAPLLFGSVSFVFH